MNASPAAVPSTTSTFGGAARATSSPSSSSTAPSAPSVSATSPSRARERLELEAVDDGEVGIDGDPPRGAALRQNSPLACSHAAMTASSGISCWQRTASAAAARSRRRAAFAPGETTIVVSPSASTVISATPVGASVSRTSSSTPGLAEPRERLVGECVPADGADERHPRAEPRAGDGLVRALAAGEARKLAPVTVSPGRGSAAQRTTRSRLTEPTTVMRGRHGGA